MLSNNWSQRSLIMKSLKKNDFLGNLRVACVERFVQEHLSRSNIQVDIFEETVRPNGFSYNVYKVNNGEFTIHKVGSRFAFPKQANNRNDKLSINNSIELFDINNNPILTEDIEHEEFKPPYFFVTYGGRNYQLEFARIGLANQNCDSWIEARSIMNSMAVATISHNDKKDIQISIKKEIEEQMGESINDEGNNDIVI